MAKPGRRIHPLRPLADEDVDHLVVAIVVEDLGVVDILLRAITVTKTSTKRHLLNLLMMGTRAMVTGSLTIIEMTHLRVLLGLIITARRGEHQKVHSLHA
jgi:hypothetical protein